MNNLKPFPAMLQIYSNAKLEIQNKFSFYSAAHVIVAENASLKLGGVYINRHCKIKCFKSIEIGKDVAVSENVTIWDSDAHQFIGGKNKTSPD